jgi:hypothetical protein
MSSLIRSAVLSLLAGGCLAAPGLPATQLPGMTSPGMTLAVGMSTNFQATLTEDSKRRDVVYGARKTLPVLEMLTLGLRHGVSDRCDVGGQIGVGQIGADARCGIHSDTAGVAVVTGARWQWWEGLVGHTEVQAGAQQHGWFAYGTTGVSYGLYGHAVELGSGDAYPLSLPRKPYVEIAQRELAWTASVALGVPTELVHRDDVPSMFLGLSVDKPLVTSTPRFSCQGCVEPHTFQGFDPGWRFGAMLGITGKLR